MSIVFSVINQKGGVAKTTSTYNIATVLSLKGYKTLMIDLDSQANLTLSAGIEPEKLDITIADVMLEDKNGNREKIENVIIELSKNLHIVPSIIDLSATDSQLNREMSRESVLKRAIQPILNNYDFIFIDCPPSLGLLPINSLAASDYVLIPVSTTYLAYRGLTLLSDTLKKAIEYLNEDLKVYGIIATLHNPITNHSREILEKLETDYKVLGVIKTSVSTMDSIYTGKAIVETDKNNYVAKAYVEIANKIIEDFKGGLL